MVAFFERTRAAEYGVLLKKPATAELLHWAASLLQLGVNTTQLHAPREMDSTQRQRLAYSLSMLAKTRKDLETLQNAIGL